MFPFISWQLQVVIKSFSFSKKAKDKTRLVLTGWEYKKSLYFRFCFYATIPLQHKLVLPLICTSCSVLHLCLLDCLLLMSVCEIKSHFWTVFFVLRYVSFSKFFTMFFSLFCDGAWMTFCLLCDLFLNHPVSSFSLLAGQLLGCKIFISFQNYISLFDFSSGIELFLCFLHGKKDWWQHLLVQPVSVQCWLSWLCSNRLW